ncbi:MAG: hypothetical protein HY717_18260 [Planctomycetes bacterium]|nr:hypothetical protein [Planctomycetota bacterium]
MDPHYLERFFTDGGAGGELYKIDAHDEIQDDGVDFPFPDPGPDPTADVIPCGP